MKKIILSVALFFTIFTSFGQDNIIKWNFSALALGNFSFQYEHVLNTRSSLAMGISFLPSIGVPNSFTDKEGNEELESLGLSGFAITPEYRYYCSNKAPKGFYLAPYMRYSKYTLDDLSVTYTDSSGIQPVDRTILVNGSAKLIGVGLMVGAQWPLGEHFTLDWWIAGSAFGSYKIEGSAQGVFSAENQRDIKADIEDSDIPGEVKATVTSTSVEVEYDSPFPAFRGFGICLGYRF